MNENVKLLNDDCLKVMKNIPDKSIDMILCDLPYGTTACKWDNIIPFEDLWKEYKRIIKDNGAILLFGTEPFSSHIRMSNLKMYRYDWYWHKTLGSNFLNLKFQPFFRIETISVFYKRKPTYNPEMKQGKPYHKRDGLRPLSNQQNYGIKRKQQEANTGTRYPDNLIEFSNGNNKNVHPTQKPVPLLEYLIKTYTNEGDLVLDNCMGSGSTGVACVNLNRKFIGIEMDEKYFNIAKDRINKAMKDNDTV